MKKRLGLDKVLKENVVGVKYLSAPVVGQFRPNSRSIDELINCGKYFSLFGWAPEYTIEKTNRKGSSGNLGFRNGKAIVVTASGTDLDKLVRADMIPVFEVDYTTIPPTIHYQKSEDRKPTSEFLAYDEIFRKRPDISVILHGHNQNTTEMAQYLENYGRGFVVRTDEPKPYGTREFAVALGERLTQKSDYLIANGHGFFALGRNFSEAFVNAVDIHALAMVLRIYRDIINNNIVASALEYLHFDGIVTKGSNRLAQPLFKKAGSFLGGKLLDRLHLIRSNGNRRLARLLGT